MDCFGEALPKAQSENAENALPCGSLNGFLSGQDLFPNACSYSYSFSDHVLHLLDFSEAKKWVGEFCHLREGTQEEEEVPWI